MFEWMKGSAYSLILTLYPGNITLNSSAAAYFQDIRWCMIGIDREKGCLGIRPVTKREVDLHLVAFDQLHKVSVGKGYARISNKAIIEELELLLAQPIDGLKVKCEYREQEQMLVADLKELVKKEGE